MSVPMRSWSTWEIPYGRGSLQIGSRTLIIGILNVTPDSFSDGGQFDNTERAIAHGLRLLAEGADMIDVGGESTRPGSTAVEPAEELRRVIPVIEGLRRHAPDALISIDTYKASVAEAALAAGADIINDVWGFRKDPDMPRVAADRQVPVVLMHNQQGTHYSDLIPDVIDSLRHSMDLASRAGLPADRIILDPGIGFGKTVEHNLLLLRDLQRLSVLRRPILLGTSRKSTIGKVLGGLPADERIEGTAATVAVGIAAGADLVRVHDVRWMKRVSMMTDAILRPGRGGFDPSE